MNDRELLERAAKADGNLVWKTAFGNGGWSRPGEWKLWNPINDDGDALRLAVKLAMHVVIDPESKEVTAVWYLGRLATESFGSDVYAATRRAIARAAAEVGKG